MNDRRLSGFAGTTGRPSMPDPRPAALGTQSSRLLVCASLVVLMTAPIPVVTPQPM